MHADRAGRADKNPKCDPAPLSSESGAGFVFVTYFQQKHGLVEELDIRCPNFGFI